MSRLYNQVLDVLAYILFPSAKYMYLTLIFYTVAMGIGLSLFTGVWLWLPAVVLCMVFAWMLWEWFI